LDNIAQGGRGKGGFSHKHYIGGMIYTGLKLFQDTTAYFVKRSEFKQYGHDHYCVKLSFIMGLINALNHTY
jgi:hypothetical protein